MRVPKWSGPQPLITLVCVLAVVSVIPNVRQRWLDEHLSEAVRMANVSEIRSLLRQGAKQRRRADDPDLLFFAATSAPVLSDLLAKGANPNASQNGVPLLHAARGAEATRILVAGGAAIDAVDAQKRAALMDAIHSGDQQKAEVLLASHASITAREAAGRTALHLAVGDPTTGFGGTSGPKGVRAYSQTDLHKQGERLPILKALLRAGAKPSEPDGKGSTPLHQAIRNGALELARCLIAYGSDLKATDQHGQTPLTLAESLPPEQRDLSMALLRSKRRKDPSSSQAEAAGQNATSARF